MSTGASTGTGRPGPARPPHAARTHARDGLVCFPHGTSCPPLDRLAVPALSGGPAPRPTP
ncbi:hypothetical protein ACIG8K_10005 [Streptomyces halstedii]|uniref:hypothetical protein n=1 Tax=Streptomyces halstedii TaxID=1944 RepID=UPI0037D8F930